MDNMGLVFRIHFNLLMAQELFYFSLTYTKIIRKEFPESSLVTQLHGSFKQSQAYLFVYLHAYRDLVPQILCKGLCV